LCDADAQEAFEFDKAQGKKKIFITQEGLNDMNLNCREIFLLNVKIIRPYLQLIERLTRCSPEGLQKNEMKEVFGENVGGLTEEALSSGEYINDLALPS